MRHSWRDAANVGVYVDPNASAGGYCHGCRTCKSNGACYTRQIAGRAWHGPRTGRTALLHAINAARERLELVVCMWVPAHVGVSANAYADVASPLHEEL